MANEPLIKFTGLDEEGEAFWIERERIVEPQSTTTQIRKSGKLKGLGVWLISCHQWKIVKDDDGDLVLIAYTEKVPTGQFREHRSGRDRRVVNAGCYRGHKTFLTFEAGVHYIRRDERSGHDRRKAATSLRVGDTVRLIRPLYDPSDLDLTTGQEGETGIRGIGKVFELSASSAGVEFSCGCRVWFSQKALEVV